MRTFRRGAIALSCVLALGSSVALAAVADAPPAQHVELRGVVRDPSGAAVAQATVSLETLDGRTVATATTDAAGHYLLQVDGVLEPRYRERVTAPGFRTAVEQDLALPDGAHRVNDVHLLLGSADQTVTVTASESTGNGEIGTVAQAGILGNMSESDMPYSVSSYTAKLVQDQQAQTVSDVLRNEVGIQDSNGRYSEDQYLILRGFVLDVGQALINGIPGLVDERSPSIENVDRIEIFKGPSSFLNGASAYGAAGGVVNMVTKRAGEAPYYHFDGGYSSSSEKEGHLDMGRRFLPDHALGVRVTLGGRLGNTPIDNQEENVGAGGLNMDYRGKKLHLSFDGSDQARSMLGFRDAIYVSPDIAIPPAPKMTSNLLDHSSSYTHHEQTELVQGTYDFSEHAQAYGSYGHARELESYQGPGSIVLTDTDANNNPILGEVEIAELPFTSNVHTQVGRVGTRFSLNTGAVHHDITLAGDYLQIRAAYFYEYGDSFESNIYNPVSLLPLVTRVAGLKNVPPTNLNRLSSVALADVVTALDGKMTIIGGLRGQWIGVKNYGSAVRGTNNTADFTPCDEACSYNKAVPSPSVAAMYHLPKGFAVYGNYVQDLQQAPAAPEGSVNVNQVFNPYVSKQEEAGAKFERGPVEATLAVYQITEPNGVLNTTTLVYGITGSQRHRGVEVELKGQVAPGLRINGGVSFLDARQLGTGDPDTEGKRAQGIPGTQSTVNAEWTVPHIHALNLDARVVASKGQFVDTAETQSIPAWARLDIGGRYEFKSKLQPSLRVNVDNVTGNNYYESSYLGLGYGSPRTVRISGGISF